MNIRTLIAACALLVAGMLNQAIAQDDPAADPSQLPITNSPSASSYKYKPLTFAQQQARYEAEQRMYRMEWNRWVGHSPLRPSANANYMAASYYESYYMPQRGILVNTGSRGWYW